jgi:hypothetical protein
MTHVGLFLHLQYLLHPPLLHRPLQTLVEEMEGAISMRTNSSHFRGYLRPMWACSSTSSTCSTHPCSTAPSKHLWKRCKLRWVCVLTPLISEVIYDPRGLVPPPPVLAPPTPAPPPPPNTCGRDGRCTEYKYVYLNFFFFSFILEKLQKSALPSFEQWVCPLFRPDGVCRVPRSDMTCQAGSTGT